MSADSSEITVQPEAVEGRSERDASTSLSERLAATATGEPSSRVAAERTPTRRGDVADSQGDRLMTDIGSAAQQFGTSVKTAVLCAVGVGSSQVFGFFAGGANKVGNQVGRLVENGKGIFEDVFHVISGPEATDAAPDSAYVQMTFGLGEADTFVASFACDLRQSYAPKHNTFSPDIRATFPVTVVVTKETLCLMVRHEDSEYPGKITRPEILTLNTRTDGLELKLTDDRSVEFVSFRTTELKVEAFKSLQQLISRRTESLT